ncbi:MAG: ABC transporter substrate-binding protein [Chloroflexota bacterium]|nr:ABC transporter substrate-binding protein [Chloroflexota bacterium]
MKSTKSSAVFQHRQTRRDLLRRGSAVAGGAAATVAAPAFLRHAGATTRQNTQVSGELVEWGFGVAPTNILAASRVQAFQEAYPNVQLKVVDTWDNQTLLTAAASETVPDLLWLSRAETASWASRGILMPLTDFIERDSYDTSRFYEAALSEATFEDEIYGIPGGMDVRTLYVNLDHLQEVGVDGKTLDTSNWEQLSELGEQLVQRQGEQVQRWGFDHKQQAGWLWLWGIANGGTFLSEDGTEATFNNEKVVEALEWGVQAYERQGGFELYEAVASTWQGDEQFAREQVSMTLYEQWMMSGMIAPVAPDLNFWVLPIRQRNSGTDGPMVSFSGGNGWYIPAGAKNPEAAWEFIKFMHTDETWRLGAEAVKQARTEAGDPYIPSLTGSTTADQLQIEELYEPVGESFDNAVQMWPDILSQTSPVPVGGSPVAGQLIDILLNEGVEPALRGSSSPQDALDTANQSAQDAIDSF